MNKKWVYSGILLFAVGGVLGGRHYLKKRRRATKPIVVYACRLPSGAIFVEEDFKNPRLQRYLKEEHLDDVIRPYKTDFDQILALAKWASHQFEASSPFPHYPPWNARVILKRIRHHKTGGFCAQYAFVFGQACQSVGYIPRYLDLASPENTGGHFTTEVYVPSMKKWIVFEPEWGIYYVDKEGHPLSALELHERAVGVQKDPVKEMPQQVHLDPTWIHLFYFFRYYLRNNFLTVPVMIKKTQGQLGFEPYRMFWADAYTSKDPRFESDAIGSSDVGDFQFALVPDASPEYIWQKQGDFYSAVATLPPYHLRKILIPRDMMRQIVKNDFVHDASYHRLRS